MCIFYRLWKKKLTFKSEVLGNWSRRIHHSLASIYSGFMKTTPKMNEHCTSYLLLVTNDHGVLDQGFNRNSLLVTAGTRLLIFGLTCCTLGRIFLRDLGTT